MEILEKTGKENYSITKEEIIRLLEIENQSKSFYELLAASCEQSRRTFGNRGYVFTQIGINAEPCPINCKFCSMGARHFSMDSRWEKTPGEICEMLIHLQKEYFDDFFLMTTANYPQEKIINIGKAVRPLLREEQKLVANIGDFGIQTAIKLKEAGFTGAYHINRLGEGADTQATPTERLQTLQAIQEAGLELYYCIEPIGPEHTYEELAEEIVRARELHVNVMAAMRRVAVQGTPLYERGQITPVELTKIVAVTNLAVQPTRAMNVHEPMQVAMLAGVNQLYAEIGANPRDTDSHTEKSRGFNPTVAWKMLNDFGYKSTHT